MLTYIAFKFVLVMIIPFSHVHHQVRAKTIRLNSKNSAKALHKYVKSMMPIKQIKEKKKIFHEKNSITFPHLSHAMPLFRGFMYPIFCSLLYQLSVLNSMQLRLRATANSRLNG